MSKKLPKQVQAAVDEAKRIEAEMRKQVETPAEPQPSEVAVVANAETPKPVEQPVVAQPAPQPTNDTPEQQEVRRQLDALAHQYRTLQGIHRSLLQERNELSGQVQTLTSQVADLQKKVTAAPAPQVLPASPLTKEEIEEFGPELVAVIERVASTKAAAAAAPVKAQLDDALSTVAQLREQNNQLVNSVKGVTQNQQAEAEERFFAALTAVVPDWQTVNYDQNFLAWLGQPHPQVPNATRHDVLNHAVNNFHVDSASSFFKEFKALVAQRAQPQPRPTPVTVPPLSEQVVPQSRPGADTVTPVSGKVWTQREIQAFYEDVARGRYKHSPEEQKRVERDIYKAQRENRIAA